MQLDKELARTTQQGVLSSACSPASKRSQAKWLVLDEQRFYSPEVLTRPAAGPNCQSVVFISVYDSCRFWIGVKNMDTRLPQLYPPAHRKQGWHTTSANAQPSGTLFGDYWSWKIPRSGSSQATRQTRIGSCRGPRMNTRTDVEIKQQCLC